MNNHDYLSKKKMEKNTDLIFNLLVIQISFFLRPGESLPGGVRDVHVLGEEDGVLVRALLPYGDHKPGDKW
jgi:hypothetical protein